jgi:hypothetical protein
LRLWGFAANLARVLPANFILTYMKSLGYEVGADGEKAEAVKVCDNVYVSYLRTSLMMLTATRYFLGTFNAFFPPF